MQTNNKILSIYKTIKASKKANKKLLAILLDPDKLELEKIDALIDKIKESPATHIFVGGSLVRNSILNDLIIKLKQKITLPILLFPGDPSQISNKADGILFLSLISGRNPDYLIEHQVNSVSVIQNTNLEIISTGYILIDGGKETAVQRVSNTKPMDRNNIQKIVETAIAGTWLGNKLIYLEAGSGANICVPLQVIHAVKKQVKVPLIVGGGIKSYKQIEDAYNSGADLVVIGTAFEMDSDFFKK